MSDFVYNGKDVDLSLFNPEDFSKHVMKMKLGGKCDSIKTYDFLFIMNKSYTNFIIMYKNDFIQMRIVERDGKQYIRVDFSNENFKILKGASNSMKLVRTSGEGYLVTKPFDKVWFKQGGLFHGINTTKYNGDDIVFFSIPDTIWGKDDFNKGANISYEYEMHWNDGKKFKKTFYRGI